MIDIFIIRAYFLEMFYYIYEFINIFNLSNIKSCIISNIACLISWFKNFYTLNEIYSLNISNNSIYKRYYSTLYFNILYTCYNFPLLYPLYYILFMINPILSKIYVLNVKYNNYNYKLIVDNTVNFNIDMIFKYRDYILTNDIFDMKYVNLNCSNNPLNTNNHLTNLNSYVFNNKYQTLYYIMLDINSEFNIVNYLMPLNIEITDIIDETDKISVDINNNMINMNISILCEQSILNESFNN